METRTVPEPTATKTDEMPLLGIDHIELYVGNAAQAAYWFTHALGLRHTAYSGLETGGAIAPPMSSRGAGSGSCSPPGCTAAPS